MSPSKQYPLTIQQRRDMINRIIDYFQTERDETIGVIAAEEVLEMFLEGAAADIYNKGVEDTVEFLKAGIDTTILDLDATIKK
jgi:uncharacterized protein (DUF2164 family)